MKIFHHNPIMLRFFFLSLSLSSLLFLLLLLLHLTTTPIPGPPPTSLSDLRIRPGYSSYDAYIHRQLTKTLNSKLRTIWTTRDWTRKVDAFSRFFHEHMIMGLLSNGSKSLCIGARVGQEVAALRRIGVNDSVGIDLVPYPPLVLEGDFHHQPFDNDTFDFEFSNVFDHALYPSRFVGEIERTLRGGGVCVLHVAIGRRTDKYSANDLYSVGPLLKMFRESDLVHVRSVDAFGLDTEVAFRKRVINGSDESSDNADFTNISFMGCKEKWF